MVYVIFAVMAIITLIYMQYVLSVGGSIDESSGGIAVKHLKTELKRKSALEQDFSVNQLNNLDNKNSGEKIGVFGGTFNPIHKSHIYIVEEFYKQLELDKVVLIPTNIPPHKDTPDLASPVDRLNMCILASKDLPYITVSDYEINKQGLSYTYKTLEWLKQQNPDSQLYLLMGSDMFVTIDKWKNPKKIFELAHICVIGRGINEDALLAVKRKELEQIGVSSIIIDFDPRPMSSTEIRGLIKKGDPTDNYLDRAVAEYIKKKRLYRNKN